MAGSPVSELRRPEPMKPGTVFSVEPQMWIAEEKLYVCCEHTIVVGEDGIENLTALAPLEFDEVEAVMKEEGMCAFWHSSFRRSRYC